MQLLAALLPGAAMAFPYETCTRQNGYLEAQLKSGPQQACILRQKTEPLSQSAQTLVDSLRPKTEISCIATAMSRFSVGGAGYSYSQCGGIESSPVRRKRPCLSERYVRFIAGRVKEAASCVFRNSTVDPAEVLPLLARESGFHLNVVSGTGCRGIGQLSRIAVAEIDQIDRGKARKKAAKDPSSRESLLGNPECAPLQSELSKTPRNHKKSLPQCEVIAMPENPARNLLYSFRLYRLLKEKHADVLLEKNSAALSGLSDAERKGLSTRLARTMYNGGYPSVEASFRAFLKSSKAKTALSSGDNKGQALWKGFEKHILAHYPYGNRREVSEYARNVEGAAMDVNQKEGGRKCF
jgi:hypothetical protein